MITLIFLFILTHASAAPKEIEVWFLSNTKTAQLLKLLDDSSRPQFKLLTQLQCQEMGDYCFDPQYGLYKKDDANFDVVETEKILNNGPSIPSAKSVERDLINCDKNNFFDIFCGKAKKLNPVNTTLDIWVDVSSSMREFDPLQKDGSCHRKSFIKKMDQLCGFNQKFKLMIFDTSIKEAGSMDQVCTNIGLNDHKRLMDWIERSDAKKLIIITDIYELHKEFADFIENKGGKIIGDKDAFTAKQTNDLTDQLAKSCK